MSKKAVRAKMGASSVLIALERPAIMVTGIGVEQMLEE